MNDIQAAELAGFFWGEGNFMIDIMKRGLINSIRVRVRISQRVDDISVLYHIMELCEGVGHITKHGNHSFTSHNGRDYTNHEQHVWQIQDKEQVSWFLDVLEQSSSFPAKKRKEIAVIRDAIKIMRNKGYRYSSDDLEQLAALKLELSEMRRFSE